MSDTHGSALARSLAEQPGVGRSRRALAARGNRVECALTLLLIVAAMVAATLLTPNSAGCGTHRMLLMPPCGFRWLTGLPCPFCGMTTAFAHMARGELGAALGAHALGPLAYVLAWVLGLRALLGLLRGTPLVPERLRSRLTGQVVLALLLAAWAVNIVRHFAG